MAQLPSSGSDTIGVGVVVTSDTAGFEQTDAAARQTQATIEETAAGFDAATTNMEANFVSLGATGDDYAANMKIIADQVKGAVGDMTVVDLDANKEIIASNDEVILSYDAVAKSAEGSAAKQDASSVAKLGAGKSIGAGGFSASLMNPYVVAVAAAVGVTYEAVKAAGNFQAALTRLVTSAGESEGNLKMVSSGILDVARDTGYGTTELGNAMYIAESGGQHGAAGLATLKAAAQGAKTENADLVTVVDAVTSAMTDYHYPASQAATVTSKLVAATGQGKTTFQDLAGAMSAILPKASAAHISLNEILGDLASMTLHGISAQQAAENMADAVQHLQSPTQAMSKELAALGLNSTELSQHLGTVGLTGTIQTISRAIQDQMGTGTTGVILNMENALKGLPKSVQDISQEVINGTATWGDWNKATKGLTVTQRSQAQSFATLFNGMHTIGTEQMSGAQVMQTYAGAMNKAMGDSAGLNVALMLTGQNTDNTTRSIKAVSKATAESGNNVKGWSEIQKNMNTQMSIAKQNIETAAISLGTKLLPYVTQAARDFNDFAGDISKVVTWYGHLSTGNQQLIKDLGKVTIEMNPLVFAFQTMNSLARSEVGAFKDLRKAWDDLFKGNILGSFESVAKSLSSIGNVMTGGAAGAVIKDIKGLAHFAGGTNSAPGGWSVVGENGPELINLPQGSQVMTNSQSMSSMANSHNSTSVSIGQVVLNTQAAVQEFFQSIDRDTQLTGMGLSPARGIV